MADKNKIKQKIAKRRRQRVRNKIQGTSDRPRLTVAKSLNNMFAQIIDDEKQITIAYVATNSKELKAELAKVNKTEAAKKVGAKIAEMAKEKGVKQVLFDRNQNKYHGRVKAVADGAREAGLKF